LTKPPYAYRRGPGQGTPGFFDKKPRRRRAVRKIGQPEHNFQAAHVIPALTWALPDGWLFTASATGVRLSMQVAVKMKAAGIKRGWPDIQILGPDGITRYIELKAPDGNLSREQRAFRDHCLTSGRDIWGRAKTLDEVEAILLRWGIDLKMPLAQANRYDVSISGLQPPPDDGFLI
jgi:hypothetical protein